MEVTNTPMVSKKEIYCINLNIIKIVTVDIEIWSKQFIHIQTLITSLMDPTFRARYLSSRVINKQSTNVYWKNIYIIKKTVNTEGDILGYVINTYFLGDQWTLYSSDVGILFPCPMCIYLQSWNCVVAVRFALWLLFPIFPWSSVQFTWFSGGGGEEGGLPPQPEVRQLIPSHH